MYSISSVYLAFSHQNAYSKCPSTRLFHVNWKRSAWIWELSWTRNIKVTRTKIHKLKRKLLDKCYIVNFHLSFYDQFMCKSHDRVRYMFTIACVRNWPVRTLAVHGREIKTHPQCHWVKDIASTVIPHTMRIHILTVNKLKRTRPPAVVAFSLSSIQRLGSNYVESHLWAWR